MSKNEGPIAKLFSSDDADRSAVLASAAEFAALTKPSVFPEKALTSQSGHTLQSTNQTQEPLKNAHQSIGSNGLPSLAGAVLSVKAPAGIPWTAVVPSDQIEQSLPASDLQTLRARLQARQRTIQESILAAPISRLNRRDSYRGFFSVQRTGIEHLLVTGDLLEHITDDLRIRVFRLDQYVTNRDGAGDVIYHVIKEDVDPTDSNIISEEQARKADINIDDLQSRPTGSRMTPFYTQVRWNPESRVWVIEQELNGVIINETEEKVTPYPSTTYTLETGERYGRGFVEEIAARLRSADELSLRIMEFADLVSKHLIMLDTGTSIRPQDLEKPSGSYIEGARVVGGALQDVAMFKADRLSDFSVVRSTLDSLNADLAQSFLTARDAVRNSERTTAFEVRTTVIDQLESALGNIASSIIDQSMRQLIRRAEVVLVRDKRIPDLQDSEHFKTEFLTGLAGFDRQRRAASVRDFITDAVGLLGERALEVINPVVATRELAQIHNIDVPGLVLTDQEIARNAQEAQRRQVEEQATSQAVQTTGQLALAQAS